MKVFQPRHIQEKKAETPQTPVAKTDKTPQSEVMAVLSTPLGGLSENIAPPQPQPEVTMPEPITPSSIWLEAMTQAQKLDPKKYVLRVIWPSDDVKELARLIDPGKMPQALEALSKRYPLAEGVAIHKPIAKPDGKPDLEVILRVGACNP